MFGMRLKELRKKKRITQEQLAQIIGVERSSIGKYEGKGQVIPSDDVKTKIAEYFDVSIDYLLGRTDTPNEKPTAVGDGLDQELIDLLSGLSPQEVQRVRDFVAGLIASRAK